MESDECDAELADGTEGEGEREGGCENEDNRGEGESTSAGAGEHPSGGGLSEGPGQQGGGGSHDTSLLGTIHSRCAAAFGAAARRTGASLFRLDGPCVSGRFVGSCAVPSCY